MMFAYRVPRRDGRRGAILIVVLVVVMMVSLAAYHFTMSMESEHLATRNGGDQISARHCALSGVELVSATLAQPRFNRGSLFAIADTSIDLWPTETEDARPYRVTISFPQIAGRPEINGISHLPDESAKLNLRMLLQWDQQQPGIARAALLRLPGMDDSTADQMLDWIDSDTEPRAQGGEAGARNSLPLSIDELQYLSIDPAPRAEDPAPRAEDPVPRAEDPVPRAEDRGAELLPVRPAWLDYLTIHSAERNESFDGRPRVFVNDPDLQNLHRHLTDNLTRTIADYIILYRQYGASEESIDPSLTAASTLEESIDWSVPASVEIVSLAQLIDSAVRLPELESTDDTDSPPRIVSSPLRSQAAASAAQPIDEVLDVLTVTKATRIIGRVNVLTAPAAVLAAVPGATPELAEQIVRRRNNSERSFRHPIGLLSSLQLDSTIVETMLPHLTVSGDVVEMVATGSLHWGSADQSRTGAAMYRCRVLLDASDGPTRTIIFRRQTGLQTPIDSTAPSLGTPASIAPTPPAIASAPASIAHTNATL